MKALQLLSVVMSSQQFCKIVISKQLLLYFEPGSIQTGLIVLDSKKLISYTYKLHL